MKLFLLLLLFSLRIWADDSAKIRCTDIKECAKDVVSAQVYDVATRYPNLSMLAEMYGLRGGASFIDIKVTSDGVVSGNAWSVDKKFRLEFVPGDEPTWKMFMSEKLIQTEKQELLKATTDTQQLPSQKVRGAM